MWMFKWKNFACDCNNDDNEDYMLPKWDKQNLDASQYNYQYEKRQNERESIYLAYIHNRWFLSILFKLVILISMSTVGLFNSCVGSWWDIMGVTFDVSNPHRRPQAYIKIASYKGTLQAREIVFPKIKHNDWFSKSKWYAVKTHIKPI